jgi:hypothetical protein
MKTNVSILSPGEEAEESTSRGAVYVMHRTKKECELPSTCHAGFLNTLLCLVIMFNRGDEPIRAIKHTNMETPHVAILNKQKCHFFFFFICYTKSENRRVKKVMSGRIGSSGRGEEMGEW